ncbi:MAG: hypothetical protein ACREFQ_12475, partial [Stellaceae bacterium]
MIKVSTGRGLAAALVTLLTIGPAGVHAQPANPAAAATSASAMIGTDLDGTACRWEKRTDVPAEHGAPPSANILCGQAKQPTASVTPVLMPIDLPKDAAGRHHA